MRNPDNSVISVRSLESSPVLAGKVVYPMEHARKVLRFYRDYTSAALTAYASFVTTSGGLLALAVSLCYCGVIEEGERVVSLLRTFGASRVDLIHPRSYLKLITRANAGAPAGHSYYKKASTLSDLSDEAIEMLMEYGTACTSPLSQVLIQHVHDAACWVDPTETAITLRDELYVISIVAAWDKGEVKRHAELSPKQLLAKEKIAS